MQRSGEMITELLDDDLQTTDTETSIELNFLDPFLHMLLCLKC